MAISGGDGSITLTTKVDTSGVSKAGSTIKGALKGAGVAVASVGAAIASTAAAFIVGAKETAAYGDRVDKLSQKIGMTKESFQQWDYIMQINGSSIETLQMGMKTLSTAAQNESDAFNELGLSQEFVKSASPEELFESTVAKLQEMGESTERTALASKLLGRSATELAPLLNSSADSVEELKQQAIDYGFVMSDEAVAASAAFTDSLTTLGMTTTGLKNKMMAEFLPALTSITDGIALLMTGDMSGLDQINEGITDFVNKISEIMPQLLQIGGSIITSLISGISANLPALLNGIIGLLPQLLSSVADLITQIALALPTLMQTIVSALPTIIQTIVSALPTMIPALINGIVQAIVILISYLPQIIEPIINSLPMIISALIEALLLNVPALIQGSIQLVAGIVQAIPQIIVALLQSMILVATQVGQALFNALPQPIKDAFQAAFDVMKAVWDLVAPYFTTVWETIKSIFSVVQTVLGGFFETAWTYIKSIWDNVTAYFEAIWGTIKEIFSVVASVLKDNWKDAWTGIKGIVGTWVEYFRKVWSNIKNVFKSVKGWFKDTFQSAWTAIKNVFSSWGTFFDNLWTTVKKKFTDFGSKMGDAIGGAVKSGINGVISLIESTINKAINLINGGINLINLLPGVSVGKVSNVYLPRLAQGAVIPPNREFLAVLGDQKSGTNIETPLKTMIEAFNVALDRRDNIGGGDQTIVVTLDGEVLFRNVVKKNKNYTIATGVNPLGI